jgi:hypothetical protein
VLSSFYRHRERFIMAWTISERADAFDSNQTAGKGPAVKAGKGFTDNVQAEARVQAWQRELKAKKAKG